MEEEVVEHTVEAYLNAGFLGAASKAVARGAPGGAGAGGVGGGVGSGGIGSGVGGGIGAAAAAAAVGTRMQSLDEAAFAAAAMAPSPLPPQPSGVPPSPSAAALHGVGSVGGGGGWPPHAAVAFGSRAGSVSEPNRPSVLGMGGFGPDKQQQQQQQQHVFLGAPPAAVRAQRSSAAAGSDVAGGSPGHPLSYAGSLGATGGGGGVRLVRPLDVDGSDPEGASPRVTASILLASPGRGGAAATTAAGGAPFPARIPEGRGVEENAAATAAAAADLDQRRPLIGQGSERSDGGSGAGAAGAGAAAAPHMSAVGITQRRASSRASRDGC